MDDHDVTARRPDATDQASPPDPTDPTRNEHPTMTPRQLELVGADAELVVEHADAVGRSFYDTLFDLAPGVRPMFPDDLTEQRRKLMDALAALVRCGLALGRGGDAEFDRRTAALGSRHRRYGAVPEHYDVVGAALLATLERHLPTWDDERAAAWGTLYGAVADAMTAAPDPDAPTS